MAGAGGHQGAGLVPAHARQGRQDFEGRVVHVDPGAGGVDREEVHQAPLKDGSPVPLPPGPAVEQLPAEAGHLQQLFHEAEGPPAGCGDAGFGFGIAPVLQGGGQGLGPGRTLAHDPQQPLQGLGGGGVQVEPAGFVQEGQVAAQVSAAEPVVVHPSGIGEEGLLLFRVGVGIGQAVEGGFHRSAGEEVGLLGLARGLGQGGLGAHGGRQGEGQQREPHHDPEDGDEDHAAGAGKRPCGLGVDGVRVGSAQVGSTFIHMGPRQAPGTSALSSPPRAPPARRSSSPRDPGRSSAG